MFCNSHPFLRNWILGACPALQSSKSSSRITGMANKGSDSHSKLEAETWSLAMS